MTYNHAKRTIRGLFLGLAAAFPLATAIPAAAAPVGLELSLAIDVSGSVDVNEYNLQLQGYVQAFQSAAVQNAILNNPTGSIAVNFVQWSGSAQQVQSIGWTLIDSATAANNFATALSGVGRAFSGNTAPGSAIAFAAALFAGNGFEGSRTVIDVSGDGVQNSGIDTSNARDAALAGGISAINGLAIGDASLLAFYQNNIVGGPNSFAIQANDFDVFSTAIQNKLIREIAPVPEPMSLALFGAGLMGLMAVRRRRAGRSEAAA